MKSQAVDPQVVTGSHDSTIRLWDLAAGKSRCTLTNHKKSVRAVALHPTEYRLNCCCLETNWLKLFLSRFTFASGSADNIKQWKFPDGNFIQNLSGHNAIVNCLGLNSDSVLVSGGWCQFTIHCGCVSIICLNVCVCVSVPMSCLNISLCYFVACHCVMTSGCCS